MGRNGGWPSRKGWLNLAPKNREEISTSRYFWVRTNRPHESLVLPDGVVISAIRGLIQRQRPSGFTICGSVADRGGAQTYLIARLSGFDIVVNWWSQTTIRQSAGLDLVGYAKRDLVIPFLSIPRTGRGWSDKVVEDLHRECVGDWFAWPDGTFKFKSLADATLAKLMM